MQKKKLIHTWTSKASNLVQSDRENFWGLGDLLKGSNVLFEVCKALNIEYELDISHHPIGTISASSDIEGESSSQHSVPFYSFKDMDDAKIKIAKLFENAGSLAFNSNGCTDWPAQSSLEWRELIQSKLQFARDSNLSLGSGFSSSKYSVFHFRLGDRSLVRGQSRSVMRALLAFARNREASDVVISDSVRFKHLVRWFYPRVIVSEATPVHTGLAANNELLLQTLQDFFLIANASSVKTFSEYVWASGFVVSACRVYDIPLTEIDRKSLRKTRRIKFVFNRIRDWF